jgi:putative ABC transport system permease protein
MGWAPEFLVVHTTRDAESIVADVRAGIRAVAPVQPVSEVRGIDAIVRTALREPTVVTSLLGMFSAVALFLTAVGIYGVVASTVTYRSHELGVRIALGARPGGVVWLVVRQLVSIGAIGVISGLLASTAFARLLASQLYGVTTTDAVAFVVAPIGVVLITVVAAWLPARRAARVDPLTVLRAE